MIFKHQILIFFAFCTFVACSQGWRSRFNLPSSTYNKARAIFQTQTGEYIAAGFFADSIDHLTLMGLNSNGQLQWTKKYGRPAFQYLLNDFVRRSFYKRGNFIYHACCVRDSLNQQIGVLLKFDFNGDTVWQKIYRSATMDVIPQMVTGSVDGGFLITGFFQDWNNNIRPALLIKTDANGNELWRKVLNKVNPNVSDGKAIIQDSVSKKIVIAGYRYITPNTGGVYENILILDSLGNNPQNVSFGFNQTYPYDMIQLRNGNIVVAGISYDPQTIGGYNLEYSYAVSFSLQNPSIAKWKIQFDKLTLGNNFSCLREGSNSEVMIAGVIDTFQIHNKLSNFYLRLTTIDSTGNVIFNRNYDYKTSNDTLTDNFIGVSCLEPTSQNGYVASIEVSNINVVNPFFFVKFDSNGCDSTLTYCDYLAQLGIQQLGLSSLVNLYPNPAESQITVTIGDISGRQLLYSVTDLTGKAVLKGNLKTGVNNFNIEGLANGMYFISVKDGNTHLYNQKFVVAKK